MSYDHIFLCNGRDRSIWRRLPADPDDLFEEADRLRKQGHLVTLSAGQNGAIEELFLFAIFDDARWFFSGEFLAYEYLIDDQPCGFQEVSLFENGKLVETKSVPPSPTGGQAPKHIDDSFEDVEDL
jgi:hypothetical protein